MAFEILVIAFVAIGFTLLLFAGWSVTQGAV